MVSAGQMLRALFHFRLSLHLLTGPHSNKAAAINIVAPFPGVLLATVGEWLWLISQQDSIYQMSKERGVKERKIKGSRYRQ